MLYGDDGLMATVVNTWVNRLSHSRQIALIGRLPVSAFSEALAFAEESSLRPFLGQLYFARLQAAHRESDASSTKFPFEDLDPHHLKRILRGSWSLSAYWQRLFSAIPKLPATTCHPSIHTVKCEPQWFKLWQQAGTEGGATDVLCKFGYIWDALEVNAPIDMTRPCANRGQTMIASLIKELKAALPDYFLGPA
jgi:hypothetical protein